MSRLWERDNNDNTMPFSYNVRGFIYLSIFSHRIFPDLEDFLLNLDKDSDLDEPPYSW